MSKKTKELMKIKLGNDFKYRKWEKLYDKSQALQQARERVTRELVTISQKESQLYKEFSRFWELIK